MRADGWNRIPLIRMTNINLEPGEWTLEGMIADTEEGLFLTTNRSWSIDDKRINFQFGTEIGWEIKHGKLGEMVKNPTYLGSPQSFGILVMPLRIEINGRCGEHPIAERVSPARWLTWDMVRRQRDSGTFRSES